MTKPKRGPRQLAWQPELVTGKPPKPALPDNEKMILADIFQTLRKMYGRSKANKGRKGKK